MAGQPELSRPRTGRGREGGREGDGGREGEGGGEREGGGREGVRREERENVLQHITYWYQYYSTSLEIYKPSPQVLIIVM